MADIGATLREARIRARIDISEVETRTKIRAKYLRAIENEEWDLLPGQIYVKSFLRTYGDFLGLDSRMLIDEFKRRYERQSDAELQPIAALPQRERKVRGPPLPPWAVVGMVLVALVVVLYIVGSNTNNSSSTPPTSASTKDRHHRVPRRRRTVRPAPPPRPTLARLQLVPTGSVYVCLVESTGKKLIDEQTFSAGDKIPIEIAPKLLLTLGNADVTMKVNGRAVTVAPSSGAIRLLIGPTSDRTIPLSATPTCP